MEENIKILEEKIKKMATGIAVCRGNNDTDYARIMNKEKQALENLIKGYRELEKERDLNEETEIALNNRIMDLEEALKIVNNNVKCLDKQAQEYFETIMFKDKIIDLMAEKLKQLREASLDDCFIPRSYRDINDCVRTTCEECTKQYFKKKVEEKR